AEKKEAEKKEAEKKEAEKKEAEKIEAEKIEAEKKEAEKIEAEKKEAEKKEAEKIETEKRDAEKIEVEKIRNNTEAILSQIDTSLSNKEMKSLLDKYPINTNGTLINSNNNPICSLNEKVSKIDSIEIKGNPQALATTIKKALTEIFEQTEEILKQI
ncbi:MAG: hypothetical protein HQK65_00370, partial [Desulfamplus sp.]|nr:hypothetical protein [Desulfamplus sp.]